MARAPKAAALAKTGAAAPVASAAPTQVFVRMYRALKPGAPYKGWLGDCFLLRVIGPAGSSHILIDCGILLGSTDGGKRMQQVTDDIIATTGGRLDLLVVTHEHWDHISGFSQAPEVFLGADGKPPKLQIDKIWMAWTENPDDSLAKDLAAGLGKRSAALAKLVEYLDSNRSIAGRAGAATLGLEAFLGIETEMLGAAGRQLTGKIVMDRLKATAPTEFCDPTHPPANPPVAGTLRGNVVQTPGATGLRAYVLGPPRTSERLFKDQPSSGDAKETYLMSKHGAGQLAYMAATACNTSGIMARFGAVADDGGGEFAPAGDTPFARRYSGIAFPPEATKPAMPNERDTAVLDWFRAHYVPQASAHTDPYLARRGIDDDWLAASGGFALKLDSDTNNTSLVLAFELPDQTVMLFAADAQVGNWLSWHDQDYVAPDGTRVSAPELLARTRLYKVGHHGSHNATLDKLGLALMTHPELVALIPTDEEFGRTRPGDWKMPNGDVNDALVARTKGRILRNDRNYPHIATAAVDGDFAGRLDQNDLFIEYRIFG